MMIFSMVIDFLSGFSLHQLRGWSLQFDNRLSDLIRYTMGLAAFIVIAPVNVILIVRRNKDHQNSLVMYENIFIGLLLTALAFGAGVVVGFISDE